MVLRAQWPLGTIAQFFHFVAEEKKKEKKTTKNKGILWLGYHRYPSKNVSPNVRKYYGSYRRRDGRPFLTVNLLWPRLLLTHFGPRDHSMTYEPRKKKRKRQNVWNVMWPHNLLKSLLLIGLMFFRFVFHYKARRFLVGEYKVFRVSVISTAVTWRNTSKLSGSWFCVRNDK